MGTDYAGVGEADTCVHMWVEEDQEVNAYSRNPIERVLILASELELRKNDKQSFNKQPLKNTGLIQNHCISVCKTLT